MTLATGEFIRRFLLQRMRAIFDSAILRGTRERANPCIGVTRELGTDHRKVAHHRALAWRDIPAFVRSLQTRAASSSMRLLFEFLILTAARSGEARGALWSEIDLDQRTWTIPGSDQATQFLEERRAVMERWEGVVMSTHVDFSALSTVP